MSQRERGKRSIAGRLTAAFLLLLALMTGGAVWLSALSLSSWSAFLLALLVGLPIGAWTINRILRPVNRTLQGLGDGIRSFHDRDFSVRLASGRDDELGDLARLYNRVGEILQAERLEMRQRELLLQTALNQSPTAIMLINAADRVIYSNREARRLLLGGTKLEGRGFGEIVEGCPVQMRDLLQRHYDGIFTVPTEDKTETFHVAQRQFQLNRRRHRLILIRRLTGDLDRQEAEIWKKVIRVISHELNNSLAPISSFVHSAEKMAHNQDYADRTEEVFSAIQDRLDHLQGFIEGYARFARLPRPQKEAVEWADLIRSLDGGVPTRILGRLPSRPGYFDRGQMTRVLLNLVKNASEASNGKPEIDIRIQSTDDGASFLQVLDRGTGMDETTMKNALVPFYSTKQMGSGLGLALCREILEAHGGRISLQARDGGGTVVTCWLPAR